MKTRANNIKNFARTMLCCIVAGTALLSCSDDQFQENASLSPTAAVQGESTDLASIEQYGYAIPFEVKADGDWEITFQFNEGHQICYALPDHGKGPTQVKICVLDNWTDEARTGQMIVTDLTSGTKTSYPLSQKCNLDNGTRASNLVTPEKGNIIYGVGYGYNMYKPLSSAITLNPIVRVEEFKAQNVIQTEGVDATFHYAQYTGSSFSEIVSDFKANCSVTGKGSGFEAEVSAAFGTKDFSSNENEYMLSEVNVVKNKVTITNMNASTLIQSFMCDEAYANINGSPYVAPGSDPKRAAIVAFPSTDEGFYNLVKHYGTHLIRRAQLGGRIRYATTVNISKVEGCYDLNAYAKCNYQCPWTNGNGEISESLQNAYKSNSTACKTNISVYGGEQNAANVISRIKFNSYYYEWLKSLDKVENQKVISIDNDELLPIWELVNEAEAGGRARKAKLKDYILNRLPLDMASKESANTYQTGTVTRISNIPDFQAEKLDGTLIKDVYVSGQHVARICNEYIPQINKLERINVIYPVAANKVKYNMGYYPGDNEHRPYQVCCTNTDIMVKELSEEPIGNKKEIYLRGSKIYAELQSEGEQIVNSSIKDACMQAPSSNSGNTFIGNYPIVKIFNRIWQRNQYCEQVNGDHSLYYYSNDTKYFHNENWHISTVDDWKNLKAGLTDIALCNLPTCKMFTEAKYKAEDITGFNIQWLGWKSGSHRNGNNNDQMEFLTVNNNGQFGHIRILKTGNIDICDNDFNHQYWRMCIRMVQGL